MVAETEVQVLGSGFNFRNFPFDHQTVTWTFEFPGTHIFTCDTGPHTVHSHTVGPCTFQQVHC